MLDSSNRLTRLAYEKAALQRIDQRNRLFSRTGVDHIDLDTDQPYTSELVSFFTGRKRRI